MLTGKPAAHYDIVVVGGGLVGASFALHLDQSLADTECSVLVVEAVSPSDHKNQPSFDARSTALSWGSRTIFEQMALWSELKHVVTPIESIQVSDQGHLGTTELDHTEHSVEALGYVVENRELGVLLNHRLEHSSRLQLLAPALISAIQPQADGMSLSVQHQDAELQIDASLVVLADGGRSPICQQLGIEQSSDNYQQSAVITNIAVQNAHNNKAFERFTEFGPLAVLPLATFEGQARCSLVWTVESGAEEELLHCEDAEFIERLSSLFGNRLGRILKVGQRFAYPLVLSEAREQIRPGLVLLGNVAHTLHPVAGQGLNLSLRDCAALVQVLCAGMAAEQSPGDMSVLQSYLDSRLTDQRESILFTDQMTRLFSSALVSKVLTRKAGLLSLDLVPGLRKEFARRAMGALS